MKTNNKRGVSEVVTTILIIVISIAAVAILWAAIKPNISDAGEDIGSDCLKMDLSPVSCVYDETSGSEEANVVVQHNSGDSELSQVKILLENVAGEKKVFEKIVADGDLEVLESNEYTLSTTELGTFVPVKARVAGVIVGNDGEAQTCPESVEVVSCS